MTDLVSYWSFDSNANDIHDTYDFGVTGATLDSDGILNNSYYFDGVDDYMTLPSFSRDSTLNNKAMSVSVWVKLDELNEVAGNWIINQRENTYNNGNA